MMNDFVSFEGRNYKFKMGALIASSLSGFIAGVVVTTIFWALNLYILKNPTILF